MVAAHKVPTPLRVSGVLISDARMYPTTGRPPRAFLEVHLQPQCGLPYDARIDLGDDPATHMLVEAELRLMRAGALMSVRADALELRTNHGHVVLNLVRARDALVFTDPIQPTHLPGG